MLDRKKENSYITATYLVESTKSVHKAAKDIALGQSIGNPDIRSEMETADLYDNHGCQIVDSFLPDRAGCERIKIKFPVANFSHADGLTQLMVMLMGGQMDIDHIVMCRLIDIDLPRSLFLQPNYGISGIRKRLDVHDRPLVGGIIKPKTGMDHNLLEKIVTEMVEGGCDIIKEDEILSCPYFLPYGQRVEVVESVRKVTGKNFLYLFTVNGGDYAFRAHMLNKIPFFAGVHLNFWNGLGSYEYVNRNARNLVLFFQRSGIQVLTDGRNQYGISWDVIVQLTAMMGIDIIHAGMWGGYHNDNEISLGINLKRLRSHNILPSLSCGMHPGLVGAIRKRFGIDFIANTGGAIHGHPDGIRAGAKAMLQAAMGRRGKEYETAIKIWGKKE